MKTLAATLAIATSVLRLAPAAVSASALAYATPARADDTPTRTVVTKTEGPNQTLLWTGVTVFAATYTGSVIGGGVGGDRISDKNLFIPLVGPWLDLGQRDCEFRGCNPDEEVVFKSLIIASGIAQGAGVLLAVSSFFVPETTKMTIAAKSKPDVHFTPVSYAGGAGVGAMGRF